jgi:hypothetical protein
MDLPARYVVGERKALATRLLNRSTAKGSIETSQSLGTKGGSSPGGVKGVLTSGRYPNSGGASREQYRVCPQYHQAFSFRDVQVNLGG